MVISLNFHPNAPHHISYGKGKGGGLSDKRSQLGLINEDTADYLLCEKMFSGDDFTLPEPASNMLGCMVKS